MQTMYAVCTRQLLSSPPALRPGCQVPGLRAIDGAGNACILSFARSAAWAEWRRSLAAASAVAERRKASGPPPDPPHTRGRQEKKGPLPRPRIIQVATSDYVARPMDGAPIGAPLPFSVAHDLVRKPVTTPGSSRGQAFRDHARLFWCVVVRHDSGVIAPRECFSFGRLPYLIRQVLEWLFRRRIA